MAEDRLRRFADALLDYGAASYELGMTGRIASEEKSQAANVLWDTVKELDAEIRLLSAECERLRAELQVGV